MKTASNQHVKHNGLSFVTTTCSLMECSWDVGGPRPDLPHVRHLPL